jgi:hypothetical protein
MELAGVLAVADAGRMSAQLVGAPVDWSVSSARKRGFFELARRMIAEGRP